MRSRVFQGFEINFSVHYKAPLDDRGKKALEQLLCSYKTRFYIRYERKGNKKHENCYWKEAWKKLIESTWYKREQNEWLNGIPSIDNVKFGRGRWLLLVDWVRDGTDLRVIVKVTAMRVFNLQPGSFIHNIISTLTLHLVLDSANLMPCNNLHLLSACRSLLLSADSAQKVFSSFPFVTSTWEGENSFVSDFVGSLRHIMIMHNW